MAVQRIGHQQVRHIAIYVIPLIQLFLYLVIVILPLRKIQQSGQHITEYRDGIETQMNTAWVNICFMAMMLKAMCPFGSQLLAETLDQPLMLPE